MLYKTRYQKFHGLRIHDSVYVSSKRYIPTCIDNIRILSIEIDQLCIEIDTLFYIITTVDKEEKDYHILGKTLYRLNQIRKEKQDTMQNYHDSIKWELQNIQNCFAQN